MLTFNDLEKNKTIIFLINQLSQAGKTAREELWI